MIEFPKSIRDGDIELVKPEPNVKFAQQVYDIIDSQRDFLGEFQPFAKSASLENQIFVMFNAQKPDNGYYFIMYQNQVVGGITLKISEAHKTGDLGYWLSLDFNGRGIMTRCVKILENLAFGTFGINRMEIRADVRNVKSQGVAKRAGYVQEGISRQDIIVNDEVCDRFVFSKIKSEWEKENKNA